MKTRRVLFGLLSLAFFSRENFLFAQKVADQVCVAPLETERGLATAVTYPYYPTNATLKALVIFVKFSDDNFDLSPFTDLWPKDLVGLPTWATGIISSTVQSTYSHPSISGYFDEMSLNQFQLIGDVHTQLYTPLHEQSYYSISSGRNISYLTEEILTNLNPDINYAQYDTRSPGSTSSDGIVDMIFICFRTFISENLDVDHYQGYDSLTGSYDTFGSGSQYLTLDGKQIRAGFPGSGTIQNGIFCLHDIGIIVHEYGHYLFGEIHYTGIGYWGLMDGKAPGPCVLLRELKQE